MTQPTRYVPKFNFAVSPVPGDKINNELFSLKDTLDETLDNIALIQRDDGRLANQSVGWDQLQAEVRTGVNPATQWTVGVKYAVGDSVFNVTSLYRCLVAHTAGVFATDLAAGKWVFVATLSPDLSSGAATDAETKEGAAVLKFPTPNVIRAKDRNRGKPSVTDYMAASLQDACINREVTTSDADEIADVFDEAIADVVSKNRSLFVPGGNWYLDRRLHSLGAVSIYGEDPHNSRLIWTAGATNGGGLWVESQDDENVEGPNNKTTFLEKLGFFTLGVPSLTNPTPRIAVLIDGAKNINGASTIVDRTTPRSNLSDLMIRGATGIATDGWDGGVDMLSAMLCHNQRVRFTGYQTVFGDPNDSTFAFRSRGAGLPAQPRVVGCAVSAAKYGYYCAENEGAYVTNTDFVAVDYGVVVENAAAEPQLAMMGCHVAANVKCVEMTNCVEFAIVGNDLYPNAPQTGDFIGIHLKTGSKGGYIGGNNFNRPNTTSLYRGIYDEAGEDNVIAPNVINVGGSVGCIGIDIASGATRTKVMDQLWRGANVKIQNASSTAMFEAHPRYGGSVNSIVTSAYMPEQCHVLTSGATDVPSDLAAPIGSVVRTSSYDDNTATQVIHSANTPASWYRSKTSGSWSTWRRIHLNSDGVLEGAFGVRTGASDSFRFGTTRSRLYSSADGMIEARNAANSAYATVEVQSLQITDGMTAPSATSGRAKIYVDTADGDLKIIFGDGTIKTIVVDT